MNKVYNVWAKKSIEELCLMALKIDAKFEGKLALSFQKWHEEFDKFLQAEKNSDFILESKMVELNQNKNSKQPDRPDTVWKLYFTLEINE